MEASVAIIIALAFALSPYLLIALLVLFLVVGVPNLPPFLRPLLPGPVIQASLSSHCCLRFTSVKLAVDSRQHMFAVMMPHIKACAQYQMQSMRWAADALSVVDWSVRWLGVSI